MADGRIGIVDHLLEVVYETYVYVNPANVTDWCTACKSSKSLYLPYYIMSFNIGHLNRS